MLEDQTVLENNDGKFMCSVYPEKSQVTWLLNGQLVSSNSESFSLSSQGPERRMVIKNVKENDEGVVVAMMGNYDTKANLFVEGMKEVKADVYYYFLSIFRFYTLL